MKGKRQRQHGKIKLSEYFKNIPDGQVVAVVREPSVRCTYPKRILGRSGVVIGSRGTHKIVKVSDGNLPKTFIIHPIHLKKLENKK
jgi:large subunit ribosomal protein L21e